MKRHLFLLCLFFSTTSLFAQNTTITGIVTATDDPYPLPGVNVTAKGSTLGTVTDLDGNYSIQAKMGDILVFSYIGYQTVEYAVNARKIDVVLKPDNLLLDEVVAVGYGTMKKSDLTGAVTSVKADQLQKTPAASLDQALQGRAAGVTVNANSGQPGAAAEIRIRGIGTVNNSAPLYVVDGMMVSDITFLSPNDIESTEILKDASATAIYGSRGANGVILVTTKKGKEGSSNINFNAYVGFQSRWNKLDLMNSKEMAQTLVDMRNVSSEKNTFYNEGFNAWIYKYCVMKSPYFPSTAYTDPTNGFDYSTVETDWQDEVFQKNAPIQNYSISFSGANDKSNYAISASYFNQDGTIIGSDYERLTVRANTSFKVREWLTVGENLSFMHSTGRNAMNNNSSPGASILSAAIAMSPWDPTHYAEGAQNLNGDNLSGQIAASSNFKNVVNPFSMVEHSHPENIVERWVGDVYLELKPIKGLTIRSDLSLDLSNNRDRLFKEAYEHSAYDKADKNYVSSSMSRYSTLMVENTITYARDINKHSFSIMAGQTTEEYNYYTIGGSGSKILNPTDNNWYLNQATEDVTKAGDSAQRTRRFSLLGRLHYSFNSKYMATLNFRADASSMFPENLWGYFPSVALAWRVNEESWMKGFENLDNLKLRAGWGQIGNDKIASNSFTLQMFNSGPSFVDYVLGSNQTLANGATVLTWTNTGGKWETTEQMNVGVDFGFFNGLIGGSVDVYQRNTKEMLLNVTAPGQVGNRYAAVKNVGKVRNRGVEIVLNHQHNIGKVNYNISGNISFVDNELTALNGGSPIYGDVTVCNESLPLYTFWGYEYEGIYQSATEAWSYLNGYSWEELPYGAGDAKYKDQNHDGKIDDGDKVDLGNPFPTITYGLNIGLEYKGIDLQAFFQGVSGNKIYNQMRQRTEGKGTEATLSTSMRNVWSAENPNGNIPNPYGSSMNYATSSRFVENGAYLRLKNVQLGYTFPKSMTQKVDIDRLRIYASVSNLLTITNYTGYDPEIGGGVDYGNYPQSRTFMFGVNVDF